MQTHAKCIGIDVPKPKQSIQIYYEHRYLCMPNALILSQNVFGRDLSFTLHLFDMANQIEKRGKKSIFGLNCNHFVYICVRVRVRFYHHFEWVISFSRTRTKRREKCPQNGNGEKRGHWAVFSVQPHSRLLKLLLLLSSSSFHFILLLLWFFINV